MNISIITYYDVNIYIYYNLYYDVNISIITYYDVNIYIHYNLYYDVNISIITYYDVHISIVTYYGVNIEAQNVFYQIDASRVDFKNSKTVCRLSLVVREELGI